MEPCHPSMSSLLTVLPPQYASHSSSSYPTSHKKVVVFLSGKRITMETFLLINRLDSINVPNFQTAKDPHTFKPHLSDTNCFNKFILSEY